MALRGKKPETVQKRLKALFYGEPGVGKTIAAIQFPRPYLIDTERGAENDQYVRLLKKSGGVIFQTTDYDEIITEVKALLTEEHEYKTLVIDPISQIYNQLLDKYATNEKIGSGFGRHYQEAKRRIKSLWNLLYRLDMNVIITAHAKKIYGTDLATLGNTFDCDQKMAHDMDLAVEVQLRGDRRVGIVNKTRIDPFKKGDVFGFSYEEMAEIYGRESLERDTLPQEIATEDQVRELERLIGLLKVSEETYQKWIDKSNCDSFKEMQRDNIQKCIDHLNSKIKGEE